MEERLRRFNIIVGAPGTGKSTWLRQNLVDPWPENCIVHKHFTNIDDKAFVSLPLKTISNFRQGAAPNVPVKCRMVGDDVKTDYKEFVQWCIKDYRNGMLNIDDAANFEYDRPTKEMFQLARMRRHAGIELNLVYHGLTGLPIEFLPYANNLILFNTNDNISYKAKKFPYYNDLVYATEKARENYRNPATQYEPVFVKLY